MTAAVSEFDGPAAEWDAFAAAAPGSTLCHRHAWRGVIGETFGHRCYWLAARESGGALAGVLPLVRVRSRLFGRYLVSLPFLNYGGPLGSPAAVQALAAHAAELARVERVGLLELRSRVELPLDLPVSHRKVTVVLDLPDAPERLLQGFPSKLRSQVRRPFKEGVTVRFGADQVEPFYAVFSRHMRDLGTPVMPASFFRAIAAHFGASAWFGCAYLGEVPIAGGAGFVWGDEFEMTWASSLVAHNRIAANMGLYRAFMERAIGEGLRRFNFGRCTPGGGTHRFKTQWGGRDEPLWWYQWPSGRSEAGTPSADSPKWAWATAAWKRLPMSVANRIGPRIVRSIP